MNQTKILVLFGGESSEHEVSVSSARNVVNAINIEKFDVSICFIDKNGQWWLTDSTDPFSEHKTALVPVLGTKSFVAGDTTIKPDVILSVLHGVNGEDGAVPALAQLLHIPIVGCDMTSSALSMNKLATKLVAKASGIPIVPFAVHQAVDGAVVFDEISQELGATLFVKPANAGSSVGVSKASNQDELDVALAEAHKHDALVLIEKAIDARELEVAVLGNYPDTKASVVGEINPDGDFYTYDSKYAEGTQSEAIIPADISSEVSEQIQSLALRTFETLGGSGLSRVDFFLDRQTNEVYLNEINTLPGFTDISMYPKLWQQGGIEYPQLIERLIEFALEKIKE